MIPAKKANPSESLPPGSAKTIGSVSVFPNPTTDYLTIESPTKNETIEVTIKDLSGRIVHSQTLNTKEKNDP